MSNTTEKTELEKMLERKAAEEAVNHTDEPCADNVAAGEDNQTDDAAQPTGTDEDNGVAAEEKDGEETANTALAEKIAECDQLKDQLLRARADFDNYRKRMLREMDQIRQTASANLIRALLPALDNLERALAHASAEDGFVEGVGMVYKQFQETLAAEGLSPIPALHEAFDPNVHDALATLPSDTVEAGRIVEEYERGYCMRDTILRPARVVVSSGPNAAAPSEGAEQTEAQADAPQVEDIETEQQQ